MSIINPYFENMHSYNGKLHERYTTSIYNITYDTFQDSDFSNLLAGYVEPDKIIERAREIVFDFDYPIMNETIKNKYLGEINLKDNFEKAFIRKYLTDEIAYESFTLWKNKLIGKIEETIPMLNLKYNMFLEISPNDLRGGYTLKENIDNTHNDTDKKTGTQNTEQNSVASDFPVNDINAFNNLGNVNYATNGNINKNKRTDDLQNTNNGGYTTDTTVDRTDKNLLENLTRTRTLLNSYISDYLEQFNYLFLGIL